MEQNVSQQGRDRSRWGFGCEWLQKAGGSRSVSAFQQPLVTTSVIQLPVGALNAAMGWALWSWHYDHLQSDSLVDKQVAAQYLSIHYIVCLAGIDIFNADTEHRSSERLLNLNF